MASISASGSYNASANTIYFTATVSGLDSNKVDRRVRASITKGSISPSSISISANGQYNFSVSSPTKGETYTATFYLEWKGDGDTSWTTADSDSASVSVEHATPNITNFSVSQTERGTASALCSWSVSNLESGATYKIQAQGSDGQWYDKKSGSASSSGSTTISFNGFSTAYRVKLIVTNTNKSDDDTKSVKIQPAAFSWDSNKTSGSNFNVTKNEWDRLQDRCNDTREYRGLSDYSFTKVAQGNEMKATDYNAVYNAITGIPGYGTNCLGPYNKGDSIYASALNSLRDELNAAMS